MKKEPGGLGRKLSSRPASTIFSLTSRATQSAGVKECMYNRQTLMTETQLVLDIGAAFATLLKTAVQNPSVC